MIVSPPRPPQEAREIELVAAVRYAEVGNDYGAAANALLAHMRTEREGREKAERDAARYRWLRDPANNRDLVWHSICFAPADTEDFCTGEGMDSAIDAALAHSTGGGV